MVYMYIMANGGLPSPWQRVTTFDGRHVQFTTSTGQHGTTGGNSQHRHLSVATTSGGANQGGKYFTATPVIVMWNHTHPVPAAYSGYSDNDPSYYTLALWRIDLDVWEAAWRCFPAESVILAKSTISCNGFSRFSLADDKLIKLGNPGASGGRAAHTDHVTVLSLSAVTPSNVTDPAMGSGYDYAWYAYHGHSCTINEASSSTILPARTKTRLYRATSDTDQAPQNIVCFFDGTPSTNWTSLDWTDFLMGSDTDPTSEGENSHGHSSISGTSSAYYASTINWAPDRDGACYKIHDHNVYTSLESSDHTPLYVKLCPYYLNTTLYHIYTHDETYGSDLLTKLIPTRPVNMDMWLTTDGELFWVMDQLLQNTFDETYTTDLISMLVDVDKTYTLDTIYKTIFTRAMSMGIELIHPHVNYGVTIRIIKRVVSPPPVIDTMAKSWVSQFEKVRRGIIGMEWANKLESATGNELDEKWGAEGIFDLPRMANETDYNYAKRIQTHTLVMICNGTKPKCEEIIDTIIGKPGETIISTRWPARAIINFDTADGMKAAKNHESLIEYTAPKMFAAGIEWSMVLPYIEYVMNFTTTGPVNLTYDIQTLIKILDQSKTYTADIVTMLQNLKTIGMDTQLQQKKLKTLRIFLRLLVTNSTDLTLSTIIRRAYLKSALLDILLNKSVTKTVLMKSYIKNTNVTCSYISDLWIEKVRHEWMWMKFSSVLQQTSCFDLDLLVWNYSIPKQYNVKTTFYRIQPNEMFMTVTLT